MPNTVEISKIDKLFKSYNYQLSNSSNEFVRIYTLRYGMYHAAEIISLKENYDVTSYQKEYSSLGYATDIKLYQNISIIEDYLFEGFFIKTPLGNELKNRYKHFTAKQLQNLPESSNYEYIQSSFDFIHQDSLGNIIEKQFYNASASIDIINKINSLLSISEGALFIIIEAPAGFGKTCTAHEILNVFSPEECKKLPFFTELSRNREARVFKHILLNEIDNQFPNGIKQNVVLEQIYNGRIPLIIDGFDELISKEGNKDEVESMLTTIIDLLKGNAKVIITSRKTAIFSSDEFLNSVYDSTNEFSLARFEIKEPTIENWLNSERLEVINTVNFPISQISNPVLLSYLRNIPIDLLREYVHSSDGTLVEKYISFLLEREQARQNLKLDNSAQLRIFRKLIRFMCEFNITTESKDVIKELIKDYNYKLLIESLKYYTPEERPTIDDLVETLSNHVFLDRKTGEEIGFINDFILGNLVGENLIMNKFEEHYKKFTEIVPKDFALKSIESFKIQGNEYKRKLWEIYSKYKFEYDASFFFDLDYFLINKLMKSYENMFMSDREISNLIFDDNCEFINCVFSNMSFKYCSFDTIIFNRTSFQNCNFYNCTLIGDAKSLEFQNFATYACYANNKFLETVDELYNRNETNREEELQILTEDEVLKQFFQVDNMRPRPRKFSFIKRHLNQYSDKQISKVIETLKSKEYLHFKDDVGFITREAIGYLKHNK